MPTEYAIQKSAQAWCTPATEKKVMDVDLCEAFAYILDKEIEKAKQLPVVDELNVLRAYYAANEELRSRAATTVT